MSNIIEKIVTESPLGKQEECAKFTIDDTSMPFSLQGIMKIGEEYTFSLYIKADSVKKISVNSKTMDAGTEWKKEHVTFDALSENLEIYFNDVGTYYFYHTQLETGNVATDWTPNPADTDDDISTLRASISLKIDKENLISEINASADIVRLTGNRFVVDSDNFKVSEDGTVKMLDADVSGNIEVVGPSSVVNINYDRSTPVQWEDDSIFQVVATDDIPGSSTYNSPHISVSNSELHLYGSYITKFIGDPYITLTNTEILCQQRTASSNAAGFTTETFFSITNDKSIFYTPVKVHSVAPTETESYGCGLADARWSTVYTSAIDASGTSHLDGQVWMNGVADESFQSVQTYAANMYVGSSGRIWKRASSSSRQIKHDIRTLENEDIAAERLLDINVVQFKYNDGVISSSDQRYGIDLPGFVIEDLDEKYPICIDKLGENKKEWSWNAQYLIPGMLRLEQINNDKILEVRRITDINTAKLEDIDYMIDQIFLRLSELEKQNEL